jgi:carbonic anhydrase/acetyltransferase-like protein (isoleucine patch superfamily)
LLALLGDGKFMILKYLNNLPEIHPSVFVASSADIIGKVKIGPESSIWYQVVIRGDVNTIEIGSRTNIQDQSCLHVTRSTAPLIIGDEVTVGHRVILHGCTIQNRVLLGMGSIVMDHAVISEDSIVGAGSLVTIGKSFPPKSLIMGSPARFVRTLTDEELAFLPKSAENYVGDSREYRGLPRA